MSGLLYAGGVTRLSPSPVLACAEALRKRMDQKWKGGCAKSHTPLQRMATAKGCAGTDVARVDK